MANLTFPSNPVNGQTYEFNGKLFRYDSTLQRWSATRAQLLGSLPDDVTIETPDLTLDNTAISFSSSATTVYVHYTVSDDVSVSIANNGLADSSYATATLSKSNNTITITSGTADFSSANVVVTVTNNRTSNSAFISLSAAYLSVFADYDNIDWRYANVVTGLARSLPEVGGFEIDQAGSRLFVFDDENLKTYDISDIDNITQIGNTYQTNTNNRPINSGVYDATNDRLYLSVGTESGPSCRMYSYDVSDPATGITQLDQSNINIYPSIIVGIDEYASNSTFTYFASYVPTRNIIYGHGVRTANGEIIRTAYRSDNSNLDGLSQMIQWKSGKYFVVENDDSQVNLLNFSPNINSHTSDGTADAQAVDSIVAIDHDNDYIYMCRGAGLMYRKDLSGSWGNMTFLGYGGSANVPNGGDKPECMFIQDGYLYIKFNSGWCIEDISDPDSVAANFDIVFSQRDEYGIVTGVTSINNTSNPMEEVPRRNWAQWHGEHLFYVDFYDNQDSVLRVAK